MPNKQLPIRISPHALLATLVEVRYTLRKPLELALGEFGQVLQPDFVYEHQLMELVKQQTKEEAEPLFHGQGISVRIRPEGLLFNCVSATATPPPGSNGDYLGWTRYFELIQEVLTRLQSTNAVAEYSGLAVRYVNALPGIELNKQLQIQLPTLGSLPEPDSTFYQATFSDELGFRIALQLTDRQPVPGQTGLSSVFDITVRAATPQIELPTLFARLDQAHTREKEIFFGLLDEAFLAQLDPVYPE
ncbi:TIGR04255 family protein [Hymenobacter wooponensis]|uniref:TIGR04255 family protein n=1 Tax=Hymenobacter wooponensis TaxID=1525360 RepID=A0A4Z0MMF8_9BACT|nr:TIGR04255 family protein [Hymenobacter wooponensis]TGD80814.1 TIGR04255 family protein [Hymenobacter wooponensis]